MTIISAADALKIFLGAPSSSVASSPFILTTHVQQSLDAFVRFDEMIRRCAEGSARPEVGRARDAAIHVTDFCGAPSLVAKEMDLQGYSVERHGNIVKVIW